MASVAPELHAALDVPASLEASKRPPPPGVPWKPAEDLRRYERLLADTGPQVVVETGTHRGHAARWWAQRGVAVVTVDIRDQVAEPHPAVTYVVGDSVDPTVVAMVREALAGRRCMVSLDSDHSAAHVTAEIGAYGPMVSPGCHLVVEDTVWAWAPRGISGVAGTPLDAVLARLAGADGWARDMDIEGRWPVSNAPMGWWRRVG